MFDLMRGKLNISDKAFSYIGDKDKLENKVIGLFDESTPLLERIKYVRNYSYASLLYRDIRCGFIHTYSPKDSARIDDPLRGIFEPDSAKITYVNHLETIGNRQNQMCQIHFPLEWIASVTKNSAIGLDNECKQQGKYFNENLKLDVPTTWWIEGANNSVYS